MRRHRAKQTEKIQPCKRLLIRGKVFTDKAPFVPGRAASYRRVDEKKFRLESYTIRGRRICVVCPGLKLEMGSKAKGFAEQTRTVEPKDGAHEESMVFRMQTNFWRQRMSYGDAFRSAGIPRAFASVGVARQEAAKRNSSVRGVVAGQGR